MFKEIKELLSEGVKSKHFPGASYAIVNKDGLLHSDFVGYKQTYPDKILNQGNEIYDCASLTKVISTTTMVMKLIEEDKLTLNSKVISFLPMFKHKDITIYHLLTHTSGLPADIPNARALRNKEEVVSKVFQFELINEIGKHIVYSDIGFILLGFIIEKITCKPLDEYAKEVIFLPLNMSDTSYNPNKELCAPTEYRDDEIFKGLLQGRVHDEKSHALNGISGHAGLFSTPKDIAKFILSILNNDEVVLNNDTVDELFKLRETDTGKSGNLLVRALGWDKPTIGGTAGDNVSFEDTIVHTGFTGCNMWIDRKKGLGFVMLSNAIHPKRVKNGIIKYRNKIGNIITLMEVE